MMERTETDVRSRKQIFADLHHRCMATGIWMNDPENEMTLEDLKKMSTKELTALYNQHAEKQVKRMESRAKLEERTMQLLRDAGKLEEGAAGENAVSSPAPKKSGKKSTTPKPPIEAPINEGSDDMATKAKKGNKKTAAKTTTAKKEAGKRGAPLTDHTYKAIPEKSKKFNPAGNKLQASSARGLVFAAIQKKDGGVKRSKLEADYPDTNVKSALDVLVKFGFIEVVE